MKRLSLALVSAIAIAGGVVSWGIHHHAVVTLRKTSVAYHERAGQLARLQEESMRLSNLLAQTRQPASLSDAEFVELHRLRGEVSQRRGERREMAQLHETNQELLATLAKSDGTPTVQVRWGKDQLAFAGYADPESAMVTTLWALGNGDPNSYLSMLTPDQKAQLEREGKSEEFAAQYRKIGELLNPPTATGICLVGKKVNSPDEVVLDLYYEGEEKTRKFVLKRVEGEWKLQDLVAIIAN